MGVVANMAPDLFLGIIADVPFVDVLNTMLDDTPAADAAGVARVGQPDRVEGGLRDHPLLLALRQRGGQGLSAHLRLRAASPTRASPTGSRPSGSRGCGTSTPSDNLILLKTNMEAGHGGASGRFER